MCAQSLRADRTVEDIGRILVRIVVDRKGHKRWPFVNVDDFYVDDRHGRTEVMEHLVNYALRR
jgi:hypothetical protein